LKTIIALCCITLNISKFYLFETALLCYYTLYCIILESHYLTI